MRVFADWFSRRRSRSMNDKGHLKFMLEAAREAVEIGQGVTREGLDSDRRTLYAVAFALSMVGEEAAQLSVEYRIRQTEVEWGLVIGMRNRLIHGYRSINTDLVWATLQSALPELIVQLERLVALDD